MILALLALLGAPHAWDCFVVDSISVNIANSTYEVRAHNQCSVPLPSVVVLVKYLDKDGNRIGVGYAFKASYVAAGERFRREAKIEDILGRPDPYVIRNVHNVAVRAIREDALDALK